MLFPSMVFKLLDVTRHITDPDANALPTAGFSCLKISKRRLKKLPLNIRTIAQTNFQTSKILPFKKKGNGKL